VPRRNCLVVEDHTPTAWARALREVVGDEDLRGSIGAAAHAWVTRRWTIDHATRGMVAGLRLAALSRPSGELP
jgi:hypothetical protein